jgi:membrane protein
MLFINENGYSQWRTNAVFPLKRCRNAANSNLKWQDFFFFMNMKINIKQTFQLLKSAYKKWMEKDPFRESAIIAYYAVFSLPGLLVVIITLAGYFFGRDAVTSHMHAQISSAIGSGAADMVKELLAKASSSQNTLIATVIGVASIIFGATGVFAQFQKSLNIIWEVKATAAKSGILQMIKVRLFSFGLVISIGFLLLVSLVVSALLTAMSDWLKAYWPDFIMFLFQGVSFLITLAIISVLFALMFKILPDAKIRWKDVWVGSVVTALLFQLGEFALGLYFTKANPGSAYGAAGSIILILLWVSYSSMIVFYGAEFTKAYSVRKVGAVKPDKYAVKDKGRAA